MTGKPTNRVDWKQIRYFNPNEWPKGVLGFVDGRLINALDQLRQQLKQAIYPSPVYEGWARHSGSVHSRHYVGSINNPMRLSDAGDFFCDGVPSEVWRTIVNMNVFGGIGMYTDTHYHGEARIMFHVDLRTIGAAGALWWTRVDGKYYYPINNESQRHVFYQTLLDHS